MQKTKIEETVEVILKFETVCVLQLQMNYFMASCLSRYEE